MAIVLFIGGILAGLYGFLILANAQSAIHEIESFVLFLIAAVLISGACIVDGIKQGFKKLSAAKTEG